jgi:hypothetical protein
MVHPKRASGENHRLLKVLNYEHRSRLPFVVLRRRYLARPEHLTPVCRDWQAQVLEPSSKRWKPKSDEFADASDAQNTN